MRIGRILEAKGFDPSKLYKFGYTGRPVLQYQKPSADAKDGVDLSTLRDKLEREFDTTIRRSAHDTH